jgi:hypothetical protein
MFLPAVHDLFNFTEKKSGLNVCTHHTPEGIHLDEVPWHAHKKNEHFVTSVILQLEHFC